MVFSYCIWSIFLWLSVTLYIGRKHKDYLHIIVIFLLFYILNYPVKMIASKCGIYLINSNDIGESYQLSAMVLSDISTFLMVWIFFKKPYISIGKMRRMPDAAFHFFSANVYFSCTFILSGLIAYGSDSFVRMLHGDAMSEYRSYRAVNRLGNGFSNIFVVVMDVCLYALIYIGVNSLKKAKVWKKILFLAEIAVYTWYGYSNNLSKTAMLMPVISLLISYQICRLRDGKKGVPLKWIGVVGCIGLFTVSVLEFIDVNTANKARGMAMLRSFFNPSFDAPDNLTAILARIDSFWVGDLTFQPFLYNLFLSKIPRAIWPGKYPGNGKLMIIEKLLPEFYIDRNNYNQASPAVVGDALASGGILLVIMLSVIYGIVFYNVYRQVRKSENLIGNIMYLFLISNMNNFCRGGSDILGNLIWNGIICVGVCGIYSGVDSAIHRISRCKSRYSYHVDVLMTK